ncbi:MAG: hypothetical protein MJ000_12460, partial [Bacteroidales bacterium]|nr:hypothetical protein [Bacteroidales bacterium]
MQCERLKIDRTRSAVEESAPILKNLLRHPGRRASANDHHDVLAGGRPPVPEVLNGFDKARSTRIHPRQLVNENGLSRLRPSCQRGLQECECLQPVLRALAIRIKLRLDGLPKCKQLVLITPIFNSRMRERKGIVEGLANQKGLSDTSPSINDNQPRPVRLCAFPQNLELTFSANHDT